MSFWHVTLQGVGGQIENQVVVIAVDKAGQRSINLERKAPAILRPGRQPSTAALSAVESETVRHLAGETLPAILHRDLGFRGCLPEGVAYASRLLALLHLRPA